MDMILELLSLAAETDSGVGGLSNFDRAGVVGIVSAIGSAAVGALAWVWKSLKPMLDEALSNQRASATALCSFSNSQAVLTWILRAYFERYGNHKTMIVVIEDNAVDAAAIQMVCVSMGRKHGLSVVDVPTLSSSYDRIPDARVIVLDVCLPDATEGSLAAFVRHCPCPVVIYSGTAHDASKFPEAAAIIMKPDTPALRRALETVITGARGGDDGETATSRA